MDKQERDILSRMSSHAAKPSKDFQNKLFKKMEMKMQTEQIDNSWHSFRWGYAFAATGLSALAIVATVYGVSHKPSSQMLARITPTPNANQANSNVLTADCAVTQATDCATGGRTQKYSDFSDTIGKLKFRPAKVATQIAGETADEIAAQFYGTETLGTDLTIWYKNSSNAANATVSYMIVESTAQPGEQPGAENVSITFIGKAITARFNPPVDFEKGGQKLRSAGRLSWTMNNVNYSITDNIGGLNGMTKAQFISIAQSMTFL